MSGPHERRSALGRRSARAFCSGLGACFLLACGKTQERPAGGCGESGRVHTTVAAADAAGYPASSAIDAMLAGRTGSGQAVWLVAPAELWASQGAAAPADRSGAARLVVEVTNVEEVTLLGCGLDEGTETHGIAVSLHATMTLDDSGLVVDATGTLLLAKGPLRDLEADMSVQGWDLHDCSLRTVDAERDPFGCLLTPVYATTRCLDPAERRSIDELVDKTADTLAAANRMSPVKLGCQDGSAISIAYELRAPDVACFVPSGTALAPATASLRSSELGVPSAIEVSSWLAPASGAGPSSSDDLNAYILFRPNGDRVALTLRVTSAADGSKSVAADLVGYEQPSGWNETPPKDRDGLPKCRSSAMP